MNSSILFGDKMRGNLTIRPNDNLFNLRLNFDFLGAIKFNYDFAI